MWPTAPTVAIALLSHAVSSPVPSAEEEGGPDQDLGKPYIPKAGGIVWDSLTMAAGVSISCELLTGGLSGQPYWDTTIQLESSCQVWNVGRVRYEILQQRLEIHSVPGFITINCQNVIPLLVEPHPSKDPGRGRVQRRKDQLASKVTPEGLQTGHCLISLGSNAFVYLVTIFPTNPGIDPIDYQAVTSAIRITEPGVMTVDPTNLAHLRLTTLAIHPNPARSIDEQLIADIDHNRRLPPTSPPGSDLCLLI